MVGLPSFKRIRKSKNFCSASALLCLGSALQLPLPVQPKSFLYDLPTLLKADSLFFHVMGLASSPTEEYIFFSLSLCKGDLITVQYNALYWSVEML